MKGFGSLDSTTFRRTFMAVYALSALVPLLILIWFFSQYIFPLLGEQGVEEIRLEGALVLGFLLLVPALGFVLISKWMKGLEGLARDIRTTAAALLPDQGPAGPENEMVVLRRHFDSLHRELQEKVNQLSAYSNLLIDTNIRLSEQAITDKLTNLYNRRYFDQRLAEEINRAERYGLDVALIMIDLDGFKNYNDVLGHQAGDEVLRKMGQVIRSSIRKSDLPFRYGGDEFAVLLPQCRVPDAVIIARKLIKAVAGLESGLEGGLEKVSVSCGVAGYTGGHEDLVAVADKCLYQAKTAGRGKVVFKDAARPKAPDPDARGNG
ncbi:MAG: GGDEF domain-containing protein [Thermodesulfobacteriota bacterium]